MFYENAVIGSLSQSRLLKLQEAIAKDQTLRQIRFWVLLATGDHSGCKELVRQLMNGKREDDLRWIAIDGKTTLKGFLPSWASALIDEADAAAASIAVQTTPTAISEQKQLAEPLTDTHAPEQRRTQRKVKDRIENGMLCRAYKIDTYEEELEMAKGIFQLEQSIGAEANFTSAQRGKLKSQLEQLKSSSPELRAAYVREMEKHYVDKVLDYAKEGRTAKMDSDYFGKVATSFEGFSGLSDGRMRKQSSLEMLEKLKSAFEDPTTAKLSHMKPADRSRILGELENRIKVARSIS